MNPITIASGAIGLGSTLFGGSNAAKERKKMENYLNQQDADNKSWYNVNALSDYTQRTDTQNLLRQMRNTLSSQNRTAANMAVVTGATPEQQAVQKELSNKALSDTYAQLGAMGQQFKDRITDQYLARKGMIANQRMDMMKNNALSYENLMSNGLDGLSGLASNLLGK